MSTDFDPSPSRGVEHVGMTVPDIEAATSFFVGAFGAEILFDMSPPGTNVFRGIDYTATLGVPPGTTLVNVRVLRLHNGPNLELFEYLVDDQRPAARPSDFGLQHIAIYVEDIDASATAIERCGGTLLQGPGDMVHAEAGPANRWRYVLTPWGMTIEIVAYTHMEYEKSMSKRRWTPPPDAAVVA